MLFCTEFADIEDLNGQDDTSRMDGIYDFLWMKIRKRIVTAKKSGVVWRKRMRLLARDLKPVTLMKVNGDLYHGIRVNLQSSVNKLLTQAFDIPFEEGDFIERELKNGIKEKYIILKINYSTNVINMDIEKVTDLTKNRGEKIMEERERIVNNTNNFYGEATGIQIQQGTNNSLQEQTITQEFNYAKVKEVLEAN